MTLSIFDICEPRSDVLDGSVADSEYAASLSSVLGGSGATEYRDPARFFANTYPTSGLKELLASVCSRLSGKPSSAVFRLDTSYGGGKTHGLIALVHAARGMTGVANVSEFLDPDLVPRTKVRIAAFDGEGADPANGRPMGNGLRAYTPWGEIAVQLNGAEGYSLVARSDEQHIAPGKDTFRELFGDGPLLIVLDELGEYLRRVKHMTGARDQLAAFLKALLSAVEETPRAAVVYTLALRPDGESSDAFAAENQFIARAMAELESISGRKATILNPTKDDETAKVLRRRLFSEVNDSKAAAVIDAYRKLWSANADHLSDEARRPTTVEEFASTYPFHPDVLDTLLGKTATLNGFQRVRGLLRVLGRTVASVWANRPKDAHAIHLHHIDLGDEAIRREFTTRLQQDAFAPAIRNDIAGTRENPALAAELDAKFYKGLLPYATYVARAVFLHSLAFHNDLKGTTASHLRYSLLSPAADLTFIDDARTKFQAASAYLDDRPGVPLRFVEEANLTQIIAREEAQIDPTEVTELLRDEARRIFDGKLFDLIPFPAGPWDIPDDVGDGRPRLALINYEALSISGELQEVPELVARMYERKGAEGGAFRQLKNSLVFVLADETRIEEMQRAAKRRLALQELKQPARLKDLADHQKARVQELESKSSTELAIAVQQCYRHLLYPTRGGLGGSSLGHAAMDFQRASEQPGSGQRAVQARLQDQRKVKVEGDLPDAPSFIRDRTPLKKGQISTAALREEYRRDPALPILLSEGIFTRSIQKGIEDGIFVYKRGDLLAGQGDPIPAIIVAEDAFVYTIEFAKQKGLWPRQSASSSPTPMSPAGGGTDSPPMWGEQPTTLPGNVEEGPTPPIRGGRTFTAEGVLKQALNDVLQKVRSAGFDKVHRLSIRVFEAGDGLKLVPVAARISGAEKKLTWTCALCTAQGSKLELTYEGSPQEAGPLREFLEPQLRAAAESDLGTRLDFAFPDGLPLAEATDRLVDPLSRFAGAAAYVEVTVEITS